MRGTKTVIERMESSDRINELDRLLKEREDLKSEVERLKLERDARTRERDAAIKEANRRDQKWMDGLNDIASAAVMRLVLEDVATDNLDRVSGGVKQSAQEALSTTAGTAFLARMAEAERLLSPWPPKEWELWHDQRDAFLKGEGVKA